jgi:ABC-2 type transport system permease protein
MNLGRAGLLARKEWKESFNSPTPYIALGLFFILVGWFWTSSLFLSNQATMEEFFGPLPLLLGIFLPAFTMRLFAEEYKTGTIENLATLPLEDVDIVLGKYAAALAVWIVMLGLSLVYPVLLLFLGPPDVGQVLAGYLGTLLLGVFFSALGLLASALTRSQVVAFLLGFLFCFAFYLVGKTAQFVPGAPGVLLAFLGVDRHLDGFLKGVVDSRDILYFLSGTALALAGTLAGYNSRRWR